ncbi:MAG: glycosyltransferase family 39 protein [Gemmatimonadales bacterium]|nr:MAG: glycosyltransferase family 39 protein [Gemmatimonadales bacterium]
MTPLLSREMVPGMDAPAPTRPSLPRTVWVLSGLSLALHLLPRPGYGFHRDELLYLAMADHLEPLRMQFPPLIALLGKVAQLLPGPTLWGTRLVSALALSAIIVIAATTARRMGGGREAQVLAASAFLVSPLFMRAGALFQPVVFEQLWWTVATLAFVSLLAGGDRKWWLVFGLAAGLGGLTKFSAAIFGIAVATGALLSPLRRDLRTRWPWLAVATGALVALPSVLGQVAWDWPFLEQARILRETQLARVTPSAFLSDQMLSAFGAAPFLLLGLVGFFTTRRLRPFRPLGIAAVAAAILFLATGGKGYYLGPMHPALYVGGAVWAGGLLSSRPWPRRGVLAAVVAAGLVVLPMGIPLLPPPSMARYSAAVGITRAVTTNFGQVLPLPQDYADMLGWREQAQAVARVFHGLPQEERSRTVIVGGNYGRAGALAVYHEELGLPYPASRHGDFYAWGPGMSDPAVVLILGGSVVELLEIFEEVEDAGAVLNPMGVPEEQEVRVHICRKPREPFLQLWERLGVVWG